MPLMGIKEDEDIASVEADGMDVGPSSSSGDNEAVEKKILTAALMTSMVDAVKPRWHVTPTTSESSVEMTTTTNDPRAVNTSGAYPVPSLRQAPSAASPNSRVIYPRASKAKASDVVTALSVTGKKSPRGKRKMDAGELLLVAVGLFEFVSV